MDWIFLQALVLLSVSYFLKVSTQELGSSCTSDDQCQIDNSVCSAGVCTCRHYYAQFDSSKCIESQMLGHQCKINEQCSLRVANSACKNGICHCFEGFIAFRKHTCLKQFVSWPTGVVAPFKLYSTVKFDGFDNIQVLGNCHRSAGVKIAAKAGEVCYSDEHCQLWNKNTQCKFLIPKLFGRCICSDGGNCESSQQLKTSEEYSSKEEDKADEVTETNSKDKTQDETNSTNPDNTSKGQYDSDELDFNSPTKMTSEISSDTTTTPTNHNITKIDQNMVTEMSVVEVTTVDETTEKYFSESNKVSEGYSSPGPNYRVEANQTTEINPEQVTGISLGFPCQSDLECQKEDSESRCLEGICDCVIKDNVTEGCGKESTGCGHETFQCRSSNICISWFFVCDGREDCPDKSDEDCTTQKCPKHSFQCGMNGICVSLAVLCDGVKNCPNGEDEKFCSPKDRNATQGCPPHTFQCDSGECLPNFEFCNAMPKCRDGSDEPSHLCSSYSDKKIKRVAQEEYCPFRCKNGRCRSTAIVCSGRDGCGDNSDEAQCTVCRCPKIL